MPLGYFLLNKEVWGLAGKSSCCFPKGLGFGSQYSVGDSAHLLVTLVHRSFNTFFWPLQAQGMHVEQTGMETKHSYT